MRRGGGVSILSEVYGNFIGDKLVLNFGVKFQHIFTISHAKLQNCCRNVWRENFFNFIAVFHVAIFKEFKKHYVHL